MFTSVLNDEFQCEAIIENWRFQMISLFEFHVNDVNKQTEPLVDPRTNYFQFHLVMGKKSADF